MNLTQKLISSYRVMLGNEMNLDAKSRSSLVPHWQKILEEYDKGVKCAICKEKFNAEDCTNTRPPICHECHKELHWGDM